LWNAVPQKVDRRPDPKCRTSIDEVSVARLLTHLLASMSVTYCCPAPGHFPATGPSLGKPNPHRFSDVSEVDWAVVVVSGRCGFLHRLPSLSLWTTTAERWQAERFVLLTQAIDRRVRAQLPDGGPKMSTETKQSVRLNLNPCRFSGLRECPGADQYLWRAQEHVAVLPAISGHDHT